MSTLLSGSTSAFDIALESGSGYYDMKTGTFYRFDIYKMMKSRKAPCSGVYLTDERNFISGLWKEADVRKYLKEHNIKLAY